MLKECQCLSCKHYKHDNNLIYCSAFEEPIKNHRALYPCAIPEEILDGIVEHTKPYPGDNGVMYEPID